MAGDDVPAEFIPETLVRVNTGLGRWLMGDFNAPSAVGIMFEAHYTAAVNETGPSRAAVRGLGGPASYTIANFDGGVSRVYGVLGVPVRVNGFGINNGLVIPLKTGTQSDFSFEYSVSVDYGY